MRFLRPLFEAKYPLFVRVEISLLLIRPFEVLFDVDSKKVVRGLAKSYGITKFSISSDH